MSSDGEKKRGEQSWVDEPASAVGGRPREQGRGRPARQIEVPVGLEALLYRAAGDEAFRARLLADREAAAAEARVRLRPSEQATLRAVSNEALGKMIDRLVPDNPWGRQLMGKVAAAAAVAAGAGGTGG